MDWSTEGRSAPTVHHTVHQGFRPEAVTQTMLAVYRDRVDRTVLPDTETLPRVVTTELADLAVTAEWTFGQDDFPTSPIFVPRDPGADPSKSRYAGSDPGGHDGWVVVPIVNDDGFRVEVFDAADVGAGPVAVAAAPAMVVPFVLHSAWLPHAVSTAGDGRRRNRFADELDRVGELPDDLAVTAHQVADDLTHGAPLPA
jgi:hypothetical protein